MNAPAAILSEEASRKIHRELTKYQAEKKQTAVMEAVALHLGMPPVAVYEVATFYTMYNLKPTGRYKLTICTNLPCALQGASEAALYLREKLGVDFGETTADG